MLVFHRALIEFPLNPSEKNAVSVAPDAWAVTPTLPRRSRTEALSSGTENLRTTSLNPLTLAEPRPRGSRWARRFPRADGPALLGLIEPVPARLASSGHGRRTWAERTGSGPAPATSGGPPHVNTYRRRSEEHTSELQSRFDLVCRLLLE